MCRVKKWLKAKRLIKNASFLVSRGFKTTHQDLKITKTNTCLWFDFDLKPDHIYITSDIKSYKKLQANNPKKKKAFRNGSADIRKKDAS